MRVKLLKRWRAHHAGACADFPDGMAGVLIRRGICEEAKPPPKRRVRRTQKPFHNDAPDP
jgi:hypothetical protein